MASWRALVRRVPAAGPGRPPCLLGIVRDAVHPVNIRPGGRQRLLVL